MEIKTTYVADDGMEFETETECYEYEHRYDNITKSGVVFFDSKHNRMPTDDIVYCAERCLGLYVPTEESAKLVHELFRTIGCESPWSDYSSTFDIGYFVYESEWVALDREIKKLTDLRNSLITHAL
jgi:hypothetical protein